MYALSALGAFIPAIGMGIATALIATSENHYTILYFDKKTG